MSDTLSSRRASVLLAGAGNIGSPLAHLIARAGVGLLRIVDRDVVESKNIANQDYRRDEIGKPKAVALAERIQGQLPDVTIEAHVADLEDLPLGLFDVDVVLGALDSRRARQCLISERAWPLGVAVIDGGVGEGWLGRVQVFVPGEETACLECGWGEADYRAVAAEYPCQPGAAAQGQATLSPAFAGSVVAGLMAAEAGRMLTGEQPTESSEIAFDLRHRRFLVSRLRRARGCRFDHAITRERLMLGRPFADATIGDLLSVVENRCPDGPTHLASGRRLRGEGFFGAQRYLSPEQLRPRSDEPLAVLGLTARDRLWVRSPTGSALVVLE